MTEMDVLITTKRTTFDHNFEDYSYEEMAGKSDDDLQKICAAHETHYNTLAAVENRLDTEHAAYDTVAADDATNEAYRDRDLVVSVGGDGTVLETAKYIDDDTALLPIRSDSATRSIGGLCTYDLHDVQDAFDAVFNEEPCVAEWTRIQGEHGDETAVGLNEIVIGAEDFADAAYYTITEETAWDEEPVEETQQSSGIIVSTGAGSTGWYKNAAEHAAPFDPAADELRYCIREPMDAEDDPYTLRHGRITPGDTFTIQSHINDDKNGVIRYDGDKSDRTYAFSRDTTIDITVADQPLHVIT